MRWSLPEVNPLLPTIGPPAICDVFTVAKDTCLLLHPIFYPNDLKATWATPAQFVVNLQARSNETTSPILRLHIDWNGAWMDGDREMARHLKVSQEVLPDQP